VGDGARWCCGVWTFAAQAFAADAPGNQDRRSMPIGATHSISMAESTSALIALADQKNADGEFYVRRPTGKPGHACAYDDQRQPPPTSSTFINPLLRAGQGRPPGRGGFRLGVLTAHAVGDSRATTQKFPSIKPETAPASFPRTNPLYRADGRSGLDPFGPAGRGLCFAPRWAGPRHQENRDLY